MGAKILRKLIKYNNEKKNKDEISKSWVQELLEAIQPHANPNPHRCIIKAINRD